MFAPVSRRSSEKHPKPSAPPSRASSNAQERLPIRARKNHMKRVLGFFEKELQGTTSFLDKFKAFIRRGNVVDLAVGVIIGGAFGKIVTSLVNDVVMPPL